MRVRVVGSQYRVKDASPFGSLIDPIFSQSGIDSNVDSVEVIKVNFSLGESQFEPNAIFSLHV